jgi:uncharacterized protein DUF6790
MRSGGLGSLYRRVPSGTVYAYSTPAERENIKRPNYAETSSMYFFIVLAFMFVLPAASIAIDVIVNGTPPNIAVVGKWFVFWAVGWRLLLAGAKQIVQPAYTAREILGLKGDEALILVRELGFANVAMGALGVASLFVPSWQMGAALVGALFYGFAGVNHLRQPHRNRMENIAMVSDLFVAAVLLVVLV